MCGIAGIIDFAGVSVTRDAVAGMTNRLSHRGPDATGILCKDAIGLGHTRLSIIDLSAAGNQPMLSADARRAIVFNGEVYNYRELKSELVQLGHSFRSNSDTEVLLVAYAQWGADCLRRIYGMFAVAIYDFDSGQLFLARDRFGKKPLHFTLAGNRLYFASEVKALLAALPSQPRLNESKLLEYLLYRELIEDHLLAGIQSLPPGHYALFDRNGQSSSIQPFFRVEELPDATLYRELSSMSASARDDVIAATLEKSVARRLISDVPVGTLCSGGLDSSLLTAIACRQNANVTVYHVDVHSSSERNWAERVAKDLGIDLRVVEMSERSFLDNYIDCIYFNDFPLTHTNSVGVYLVSQLAREHGCKVLLTGEGADESFGGYDWRYAKLLAWRRMERRTSLFEKIARRLRLKFTGVWDLHFNPDYNFKARATVNDVVRVCGDRGFRSNLLARCEQQFAFIEDDIEREVQASMLSDLRDYIAGILHRQDRASMQASVESRLPFLDQDLAKLAVNLPLKEKTTRVESKILLKRVATRFVSPEIAYRSKVGFGSPSDVYIQKISPDIFNGGFVETSLGISAEAVRDLITQQPSEFANAFYGLEIWGRLFVHGACAAELKDRYVPS